METRSKRRRLISISSNVSSWPHVPARFESLNDDTLTTTLEFVGDKSYAVYAMINKQCKEIYLNTPGMTKETFLYGYAPLSVIQERYDRSIYLHRVAALGKGVLFYNRRDVLAWALDERKTNLLKRICEIAAEEGRIDLLDEVWNNVNDEGARRTIFRDVDEYAARRGELNVLKWIDTKGLYINNIGCAEIAAEKGQLNILQWLREEKGFELYEDLYYHAIDGGGHLHVMKWFREEGDPWYEYTFKYAAEEGNLDILQWLHDEGCPWPVDDDYLVSERSLKPEVVEWLRLNGYSDRFLV